MRITGMLRATTLSMTLGLSVALSACAIDPNLPPTVRAAEASRQVAEAQSAYDQIRPHLIALLPRLSPRDAIKLETLMRNIETLLRVAAVATSAGEQIAAIQEAQDSIRSARSYDQGRAYR